MIVLVRGMLPPDPVPAPVMSEALVSKGKPHDNDPKEPESRFLEDPAHGVTFTR